MYKFDKYKNKKDEILKNVNFDKKEKLVFNLLTENVSKKEMVELLNFSKRTIQYKIKSIARKIEDYEENKNTLYYYVYIHIFPNGKKYVGVCENCQIRWGNGFGYKSNKKMFNDITLYGWNNIKHEILLKTNSPVKARELEEKVMKIFELTNDKFGYNNF